MGVGAAQPDIDRDGLIDVLYKLVKERKKRRYDDPLAVLVETIENPKRRLYGLPNFRTLVILYVHRIV